MKESYIELNSDIESATNLDENCEGDRRWNFETTDPKEILFKHMVEGQIMTEYEKDLATLGVSKESLDNLEDALLDPSFTERDREIFYCIPYELRLLQFRADLPKTAEGEIISTADWVTFVQNIIDLNKSSDPHLGFHVSPFEIGKVKKMGGRPGEVKRESWDIEATEFDDRDDRKMAYYSLSVEKLFTKKGLKYIYIIRANLAKGHNNHPDNNGHWGRASSLSIITKLDLRGRNLNELLEEMQQQVEHIEKKEAHEN